MGTRPIYDDVLNEEALDTDGIEGFYLSGIIEFFPSFVKID